MFNLFAKKSEKQIVAEIHNEFDTAEDRLLEQADNLLKELNIPTETVIEQRAATLKGLGFINTETVVQANMLSEHREKQKLTLVTTREQAELIRYYKAKYPFQKFLTENELERICEKYNLVFAPVANYIKDVPQKNIQEIQKSPSLYGEDVVKNKELWRAHPKNIKKSCPSHIRTQLLKGIPLKYGYSYEIGEQIEKLFKVKEGECIKFSSFDYDIVTENKQGLFIAAPQSHFDLKGTTKKGKYSFLNITVTEVKDPIVFRYVRGGVQVLSKWGLEASDESLVNEINN